MLIFHGVTVWESMKSLGATVAAAIYYKTTRPPTIDKHILLEPL